VTTLPDIEVRNTGPRAFLRKLGPGLVTGAADDDPSGIATYSQAGAAFGYGLLWTALISLPMMIAVQLMCARVGVVAKSGLATALREHYSRELLWFACMLLVVANTLNIAADLGGMAAAAQLLTGVPRVILVPLFATLILGLLVFASYESMARVLKWFALALFAYVISAVLAHPSILGVLKGTFVPSIRWNKDYLMTFVAILGTTISPYLFFWQASQVAEQEEHVRARFPMRRRRGEMRRTGRELRDAAVDTESGDGLRAQRNAHCVNWFSTCYRWPDVRAALGEAGVRSSEARHLHARNGLGGTQHASSCAVVAVVDTSSRSRSR